MNLEHLKYLSQPIGLYVSLHKEAHKSMPNGRSCIPSYSLNHLLFANRNRQYKGVHEFCVAEEMFDETITCVIFKSKNKPVHYFHTLYFGPETRSPEKVHETILDTLNLSEGKFQQSLLHSCSCENMSAVSSDSQLYFPFENIDKLLSDS